MISLRSIAAAGLCLGVGLAAPRMAAAQAAAPRISAPPARPAAPQTVDPAAVKALREMSTFLQSLSSFELTSQTSLDLVANDDQKIQLDGTARYKVRKPGGFVIDVDSDDWSRRFIYDGTTFTLYAPKLGYYASWPAPATNQATIDDVESRFGISLPLDDLFRWAGPEGDRAEQLQAAFLVGTATIDGVATNHYAFREGDIDWQVWIQQGAQPLPRKLVIVNRRDAAAPAYVARLAWTLNPPLSDADFAFRPAADARRIRIIEQR